MTTLDRSPDGVLLVGQGPAGRAYHPAAAGAAVCSPMLPIPSPVPIDQVSAVRWCQRKACRRHLQTERRSTPAAAGDVEHLCPSCYVERAAQVRPCPSCGSGYAAVPASTLL